jgi:cellulose biosynthesis protein BcsQ
MGQMDSNGYVIPTIPDIVSTWGIYMIVDNVAGFAQDVGRPLRALGIVATKVQSNNLHTPVIADLEATRLGRFRENGGANRAKDKRRAIKYICRSKLQTTWHLDGVSRTQLL